MSEFETSIIQKEETVFHHLGDVIGYQLMPQNLPNTSETPPVSPVLCG